MVASYVGMGSHGLNMNLFNEIRVESVGYVGH